MYYLNNYCQPDDDIDSYLQSLPADEDGGYTYTKSFTAPDVVLHRKNITLGTETTHNIQTLTECTEGTQAMSDIGITFEDKLELTWGIVLVLAIAFSFKVLRRTF